MITRLTLLHRVSIALFTWGFGTMGALCNGEDDDVDVPQEVRPA
jgi:hypothetical protein